jgi:hypothetical protein
MHQTGSVDRVEMTVYDDRTSFAAIMTIKVIIRITLLGSSKKKKLKIRFPVSLRT